MQSIDVLSVPTTYREPKGLYILEACRTAFRWCNRDTVPSPNCWSEPAAACWSRPTIRPTWQTDCGKCSKMLHNVADMGRLGEAAVREHFTAEVMARNTLAVLELVARPVG